MPKLVRNSEPLPVNNPRKGIEFVHIMETTSEHQTKLAGPN